jgi:2-oxoglutarate ferredoxin oxidoreductase subunit alpha
MSNSTETPGTTASTNHPSSKPREKKSHVVIRLAGDSGDGMQLTGTEFSRAAAIHGNDLATFPDFPAEIRAPAGTLAGVSGFQLHFSSENIYTPGDRPDVLVAMNPAAYKKNVNDLRPGGVLVVNTDSFNDQNFKKVGYEKSPLDDDALRERFRVVEIDMGTQVMRALEGMDLSIKEVGRTKNFWALGLLYWLYNRDTEKQLEWIKDKFKKSQLFLDANIKAFQAGYAFGETTELFGETYQVERATMEPGTYRNIMGNVALVTGLITAAQKAGLPIMLGSYPITPASDILHTLAKYRNYDVTTFQAEDEIAAIGAAIGAAYGGAIGVCSTSGPGLALKGEALGLAHILEIPLIVVNVQRGGPSTGLPTKTEQADLLQCMYGRNGEAPVPIIAAQSPADCFDAAIEAVRVAIKYMTPVILLSDGYIANGAEPWKIPDVESIPKIDVAFRTDPNDYKVYRRNADTLARDWVIPGTPKLEYRIGGLEKDFLTGDVSYDGLNHQKMVDVRRDKVMRIQQDIAPLEVDGPEKGELLVVGWGGTYGALRVGAKKAREAGRKVAHLHIRWMHPFPRDLEAILRRYDKVLVCELNKGQLWRLLRAEFLIPALSYTKVQGMPFQVHELEEAIANALATPQH